MDMRVNLLGGVAAAMLAGAAGAETVLVSALNADIRSTDPGVNRDANTDTVMLHVVEGLVGLRGDGGVGPMLAESVTVGEDGRTYAFTLREGLTFHNGEPVTAADVVWTWERYLSPDIEFRCGRDFREGGSTPIASVEATDARTVTFTIAEPSALFLSMMARPDCASTGIYHRDSVDANGDWVAPIGTGPFRLGEWRKGEYIELERFEGYAALPGAPDGLIGGKAPLVDRVRLLVIPDNAAAKAALVAGDIHILPDMSVTDRDELAAVEGVAISASPTMAANGILLQTADPLLSDPRIRRAIALSLDIPGVVAAITGGLSTPNNSAVPVASGFHGPVQAEGYVRDLDRARALLAEAGYDGQPIRLMTNQRYQSMYDIAVFAQAMARDAGINFELEVAEWGAQLDRYLDGGYQAMAFGYSARLDPALSFDMFMGDKATAPRKVWDDPEAQALLEQAKRVSDPETRQDLFDRLHRMLIDSATFLIFYEGPSIAGAREGVSGYSSWAADKPRFWGVALDG
jgi:peptide/nickel transport system substrate-binding protein